MSEYFKFEGDEIYFSDFVKNNGLLNFIKLKGKIRPHGFSIVHLFRKYIGDYLYGYLQDKKGIWWFDSYKEKVVFVTEYVDSFQVVDNDYSKDKLFVYYRDKQVPHSHPDTFIVLKDTPYFAKDENLVYVRSSKLITFDEANTETLVECGWNAYCTDKDHLYYYFDYLDYANTSKWIATIHENGNKQLLSEFLLEKYPQIKGWWHPEYDNKEEGSLHIAFNYYSTTTAVFFQEEFRGELFKNLIRDADIHSFDPIDEWYSKDSKSIYFKWRKVKRADLKSFVSLGGKFAKDVNSIYYNGHIVTEADLETFVVVVVDDINYFQYSKDKNCVFTSVFTRIEEPFGGSDRILCSIKGSSPKSFKILSQTGSWSVDENSVYCNGAIDKSIDINTFEYLFDDYPSSWAKDKNGLYNSNGKTTIKGISGKAFTALNNFWGKDNNAVFCFKIKRIIKTADAKSFILLDDNGQAEDKNYLYWFKDYDLKKKKK